MGRGYFLQLPKTKSNAVGELSERKIRQKASDIMNAARSDVASHCFVLVGLYRLLHLESIDD